MYVIAKPRKEPSTPQSAKNGTKLPKSNQNRGKIWPNHFLVAGVIEFFPVMVLTQITETLRITDGKGYLMDRETGHKWM